jgi:glycosyltransferase involved in cell wall biosynthesis
MLRPSCLANQEHLSSLYPEHTDKMITIYAGSPLVPPPPPLRRPGSPFELLALGRFVPKKGYPVFIEACRILRDQGRDFHLTLAGDGRQAGLLRGLIEKYKLGEKVSLPGFVMHQQVPELFAKADLFVMSSVVTPSGDRDGIPTVIMEAMLHRVAVAGTRVSGIPEVVIPGRTGWLIPPGDANALAQALAEAMDNPDLTMRYAEAGRRFIRENFDSATNYGKLKALFEALAAGRGDLKKYSSIG